MSSLKHTIATLQAAVRQGRAADVEALLQEQRISLDSAQGAAILAAALAREDLAVLRALLRHGAKTAAHTSLWQPALADALCLAACRGCVETLVALLESGALVGLASYDLALRRAAASPNGMTPEVLEYLLDHCGASLDGADENGWSAIHHAAAAGEAQALAQLVARGANIDVRVIHSDLGAGAQPLHFAAAAGSAACVEVLLAAGADAAATTFGGRSALIIAIEAPGEEVAHVAELLRRHRAFVDGDYLMCAMQAGKAEVCALLLQHGVVVSSRHLMRAVRTGDAAMCESLLRHGACVDSGHLSCAMAAGMPAVCALLLQHVVEAGSNLLAWAIRTGDASMCEALLRHGASASGDHLLCAMEAGMPTVCALLLQRGVAAGSRHVMCAIRMRDTAMCEALLRRGAPANGDHLTYALEIGRTAECTLLLQYGAEPDSKHLMRAMRMGDAALCEALLRRGLQQVAITSHMHWRPAKKPSAPCCCSMVLSPAAAT